MRNTLDQSSNFATLLKADAAYVSHSDVPCCANMKNLSMTTHSPTSFSAWQHTVPHRSQHDNTVPHRSQHDNTQSHIVLMYSSIKCNNSIATIAAKHNSDWALISFIEASNRWVTPVSDARCIWHWLWLGSSVDRCVCCYLHQPDLAGENQAATRSEVSWREREIEKGWGGGGGGA